MAACARPASRDGRGGPPDILLLTADTLRADHVEGYAPTAATPHVAELERLGMVFEQAVTPMPRTTPALATVLTGLEPRHHGSREVMQPLQRGRLLPEVLREAGYVTLGVSATSAAARRNNLARGFDRFELDEYARAAAVTRRALSLAAEVSARQPVFVWLHYIDPHFPYHPSQPGTASDHEKRCRDRLHTSHLERGALFSGARGVAPLALEDCEDSYAGEVSNVDAAVGALLSAWDSRRPRDRVVVFTADHGENFGEDGLYFEHGPSLDPAASRVPLVVAGKGVVPGRDPGLARLEDLYATLLGLAGIPADAIPPHDGSDLRSRLAGHPGASPTAVLESGSALQYQMAVHLVSGPADGRHCYNLELFSMCEDHGTRSFHERGTDPNLQVPVNVPAGVRADLEALAARWRPEQARIRGARDTRFQLEQVPVPEGGYRIHLRDLSRPDAGDVAAGHPEVVQRLTASIDAYFDSVAPPNVERSGADVEALRSLGYVQ